MGACGELEPNVRRDSCCQQRWKTFSAGKFQEDDGRQPPRLKLDTKFEAESAVGIWTRQTRVKPAQKDWVLLGFDLPTPSRKGKKVEWDDEWAISSDLVLKSYTPRYLAIASGRVFSRFYCFQ